jgi:hypothetical protein
MTLIKNLGHHSLPPLRRISSRDSKLQEEMGMGFLDRSVTHRVKLVWRPLKNRLLAVITLSCSEVLILLRGIWAITYEMPGLSTIVAQARWKVSGLGNLLLIFLSEASSLSFLTSRLASAFTPQGAEWSCQCRYVVCTHADESPYK